MIHNGRQKNRTANKEGGTWIPALCSGLGMLLLVAVIAACIPLAVPKLLGCSAYTVVSGSMAPEIPVGSLVIAQPVEPARIAAHDVIAFDSGGVVVTHRVVENRREQQELVTKGDANAGNDMAAVPYDAVIGKIVVHIPTLGQLLLLFSSWGGKLCVLCIAACGVLLRMVAERL